MPRPEPPPTPASSTEIKGRDGSQFSGLQMSFELPPPAVAGSSHSTRNSSASATSSYHPSSPASPAMPASEVVKIRRRSSAVQALGKGAFALPPPPTRSRKIIQMKPRGQLEEAAGSVVDAEKSPAGGRATASKKKQPSSTSVAGRKIARKTAHSLIERRRRSKMNEEFGVLKDMIPACTGEMHKLAILQASIDYVRYLEDCVAQLKDENTRNNNGVPSHRFALPPTDRHPQQEDQEDVEMGSSSQPSPTYSTPMPSSNRPSESPALLPQDSRNRQDSYSSVSTDRRHYSFSTSTTTSPALGPAAYEYARSAASVHSALTSPALGPQRDRDMDQEATTALLMLNADRRGAQPYMGGRGMSVKDLLST